jgi:hypothetical protein
VDSTICDVVFGFNLRFFWTYQEGGVILKSILNSVLRFRCVDINFVELSFVISPVLEE